MNVTMNVTSIIVIASFVITVYGSLFGVYVLIIKHMNRTSVKLAKIYETVNKHVQDTSIHPEEDKLVPIAVCHEVQKKNEVLMTSMNSTINEVSRDVKTLIRKVG